MQEQEKQLQFNYSEAVAYYRFLENFKKDDKQLLNILPYRGDGYGTRLNGRDTGCNSNLHYLMVLKLLKRILCRLTVNEKEKNYFLIQNTFFSKKNGNVCNKNSLPWHIYLSKQDIEALPLKNTSDPIS